MKTYPLQITLRKVGTNRRWKVVPGRQRVRVGDKVTWRANTRVSFWLPERKLFGREDLSIPKGKKRTLSVQKVKPGRYFYSVYCHDHRCFASGSEPEMIVR